MALLTDPVVVLATAVVGTAVGFWQMATPGVWQVKTAAGALHVVAVVVWQVPSA